MQNPDCDEKESFFKLTSRNEIYKMANELLSRMFSNSARVDINVENVDIQNENRREHLSLQEELNLSILESVADIKPSNNDVTRCKRMTMKQEFNMFQATGERTPNLQLLRDALSTIKPTSTQNERNFSIATDFVSKKRTRLSSETLDALCFLKSYFKSC